jgi:hypothetical protein
MFHTAIRHAHTNGPAALGEGRRGARPTGAIEFTVLLDAITEAVASISFREAPRWVSSGVALLVMSSSYACRNSKLFHLFRSRLGGNG